MHALIVAFLILEAFHPSRANINYFKDDSSLNNLEMLPTATFEGDQAQRFQFPYQVSLQCSKNNLFVHVCSGTVLSSQWVVTSAYCAILPQGPCRIVAGLLIQNETHPDTQIADILNVVAHPKYVRGSFENDIALLYLKMPLLSTKSVQPIAPIPNNFQGLYGAAILSGWNVRHSFNHESFFDDTLHYTIVHIMTDLRCKNAIGPSYMLTETMLCSEREQEMLFCFGESGAPLVHQGFLVGIASWGSEPPCGITVYTKVQSFLPFIEKYVREN